MITKVNMLIDDTYIRRILNTYQIPNKYRYSFMLGNDSVLVDFFIPEPYNLVLYVSDEDSGTYQAEDSLFYLTYPTVRFIQVRPRMLEDKQFDWHNWLVCVLASRFNGSLNRYADKLPVMRDE